MTTEDFLEKTPGEIYGLVACHLVMQGLATEKKKPKKMDFDAALALMRK